MTALTSSSFPRACSGIEVGVFHLYDPHFAEFMDRCMLQNCRVRTSCSAARRA